jgi:hypothetical protein
MVCFADSTYRYIQWCNSQSLKKKRSQQKVNGLLERTWPLLPRAATELIRFLFQRRFMIATSLERDYSRGSLLSLLLDDPNISSLGSPMLLFGPHYTNRSMK